MSTVLTFLTFSLHKHLGQELFIVFLQLWQRRTGAECQLRTSSSMRTPGLQYWYEVSVPLILVQSEKQTKMKWNNSCSVALLMPVSVSCFCTRREFRSNQPKPAACKCPSTGWQLRIHTHTCTRTHAQTTSPLPLYFTGTHKEDTNDILFALFKAAQTDPAPNVKALCKLLFFHGLDWYASVVLNYCHSLVPLSDEPLGRIH